MSQPTLRSRSSEPHDREEARLGSATAAGGFASSRALITGAHRSGTTWLGNVAEATENASVIHEPFNSDWGLTEVTARYPYADVRDHGKLLDPLGMTQVVDRFFDGNARFRRFHVRDSLLKRSAKLMTGGRVERHYRRAVASGAEHVVLKDPFCLLMTPMLVAQFRVRTVVLCRHPGAYYSSMVRMGWHAPLQHLIGQPELRAEYAADVPEEIALGKGDELIRIGYFWRVLYRFVAAVADKFPEMVMVVRHEDLATNPQQMVPRTLSFLDIPDPQGTALSYAIRTTSGGADAPPDGKLHEFQRNGAGMVKAWKKRVDAKDQLRLRTIVEDVSARWYGPETWE